jgi:predicted glycosyltransferase
MCCNDNRGWWHTLRTLDIAAYLCKTLEGCSILVLTDLATIGRFKLAERVDYVHLPSLNGKARSSALLPELNIEYGNVLKIRRKITESAIKTFRPDLVMLDDSLLDFPHVLTTQKLVSALADELPNAKIVCGLPDTVGEPEVVIRQWARNEVLTLLGRFADEILIFGTRQVFDAAKAYRMPESLAHKLVYTGYLARRVAPPRHVRAEISKMNRGLPMVILAPEGGTADESMIDAYLRFLESKSDDPAVQSLIFAGPAIDSRGKHEIACRVQKLPNVVFHRFGKHLLHYVRFANLVICNGGYNMMCEILAHRKTAVAVPSLTEKPDDICRARLFQQRDMVTVMPPEGFHPSALREVFSSLLRPGLRLSRKYRYDDIHLDGLDRIAERVRLLTGGDQPIESMAAPLAA